MDRTKSNRASRPFPDAGGRRPSGVYESAAPSGPTPLVRVAYLLRPGLRPPERQGVITILEPTADARPMNAYVVDALADRELVAQRIASATAALSHPVALPAPLFFCGACDGSLARAVTAAMPRPYPSDLGSDRGLDYVAGIAHEHAVAHAATDPASLLSWYYAGLGEWVAQLYAQHGFTRAELRVLALRGLGLKDEQLALLFGCTLHAVRHHTDAMRRKAGHASTDALLAPIQRRLRGAPDPGTFARLSPRVLHGTRTPPDGMPL